MPPGKRPGTFFARHRREVLAMLGGALAAMGLWLFLADPDPGAVGTGAFASPSGDGPPAGGDAAVSADSAAATGRDEATPGEDETATPPPERTSARDAVALETGTPRRVDPDGAATEPTPLANAASGDGAAARSTAERRAASDAAPSETRTAPSETRTGGRASARLDEEPPATSETPRRTPGSPAGDTAGPGDGSGSSSEPPGEEAVPATAVEARVAAEVAITRYARAVESADLEALGRAHPGLTADDREAWRRVFEKGETFVASLRIADFVASGTEARADVRGSCHFYDLSLRRFVDVPVEFELFLHHDGRSWRPVLASGGSPDTRR